MLEVVIGRRKIREKIEGVKLLSLDSRGGGSNYRLDEIMHRLIVNPGTENAWEIPLAPGVTSVGRDEDNTIPLEHPSVSSRHCELTVTDFSVVIKDLGSSNGTTLNGTPVEEAPLQNGQMIQLGDVTMQYEHELPRATRIAAASPALPSGPLQFTAYCKMHPRVEASFLCPQCKRTFCTTCISPRGGKNYCRACSVECSEIKFVPPPSNDDDPFFKQALGAFKYPFKGDGLIILGCGGFVFLLAEGAAFMAKFALVYGLTALVLLCVFIFGYSTRFFQYIITDTVSGKNEMPDLPDMTDFGDEIRAPFFQLLGLVVCCFAPAIGLTIYADRAEEGGPWLGVATVASMLVGAVYFPMAFAAVAMYDSLGAVNPLLIVPSILKIPKEYGITIALFAVILIVRWICVTVVPDLLGIPYILPAIIANFLGLYLVVVLMRILGLMVRINKYELGWGH
jgi:hypothetical protein